MTSSRVRYRTVGTVLAAVLLTTGVGSMIATTVVGPRSGADTRMAAPRALDVVPPVVLFPVTTLGTQVERSATLSNTGSTVDTVDLDLGGASFAGPSAGDYQVLAGPDCPHPQEVGGDPEAVIVLDAGQSCGLDLYFTPHGVGDRPATLTVQGPVAQDDATVTVHGTGSFGYYQVDRRGTVAHLGDATWYGDAGGGPLREPVVGMAATPDGHGYWLVAADGGVFAYGDAAFYGSTGGTPLDQPVVGMAATPDGHGYWLVAADGGVFAFGDAAFFGSTGGTPLNRPVVGMAAGPYGRGYWLVAADGGVFAYGDAPYVGSAGGTPVNQPVVAIAAAPGGRGYWLVAADGGVFAYGTPAAGSTGGIRLAEPVTTVVAAPGGGGYALVAADGGVFAFGDAPFLGSGVGLGLGPVVGAAPAA